MSPEGMTPEHKQAWIQALQSGQYPPARGYLCAEGGFCYMGVLGDLVVQGRIRAEGLSAEWKDAPGQGSVKKLVVTRELDGWPDTGLGTLPIVLARNLGLVNGAAWINGVDMRDGEEGFSLADLNDSGEFTPAQIADLIRYFL